MGVNADDDIDHLTKIGKTGHAFSPLPEVGRGSGPVERFCRPVVRHAGRGLPPGGQAPDQASSSNRAGASNHERTSRTKAETPVFPRVTPAVTNHSPSPSGCQGDPHNHTTAIDAAADPPLPTVVPYADPQPEQIANGGARRVEVVSAQ